MPTLYIMCGVGFSGKSTLAKKISEHIGAVLVSQDGMFFEKEKELDLSLESDEQWEMLWGMCKEKISENLKMGESVVFDTTNLQFKHREEMRELAKSCGAKPQIVFLDTPIEVQKERQNKNLFTQERHDVKQEYLDDAISSLEVPQDDESPLVFKPDTNLEEFLKQL